jgi:hypothetical protein
MERNPLDSIRPQMAKASLDSQSLSIEMTAIARDALIRHFGSLKAAAIEMQMDQGQLTRDLDAGKLNLARLAKCGTAFLLKWGSLMVEHAQPLSSPKARWQDLKQRQRQIDDERDQLFEHVAS